MEDDEKIKQRFALLKMARELLNEEYINKRAEDHNRWVAENDEMWRTRRRNLPYPPFAQYPTDEEVIKAATNLYNFMQMGAGTSTNTTDIDVQAIVTAEPLKEIVMADIPVPEATNDEPISSPEDDLVEFIDETHESEVEEPSKYKPMLVSLAGMEYELTDPKTIPSMTNIRRLLPGWVRREE